MKKTFALILLLGPAMALGQHEQEFYVTGYAPGGDCGHPAIGVRAKDRVDALRKAHISLLQSGVTVWTSAEYAKMRKDVGKQFDEDCAKYAVRAKPEKPEPVDVPPITEEYGNPGYEYCDMRNCMWVDGVPLGFDHTGTSPAYKRRTRLTCADKTRFLMTSEDGKKHCIKLGD